MKEYFETWINPDTSNTEQIKVTEYTFQDWEQGLISGKLNIGKRLSYNSEKEYRYTLIPPDEYDKIIQERERLYWQKVEKQFDGIIKSFETTYQNSGNKELLLKLEIEKIEKRFLNNPLYEQLVVRANRDYTLTNGPNCQIQMGAGDFHHVQIEYLAKYWDWLKTKSSQLFIESTNKIEKTDARIWLTTIFDESIHNTSEYKGFKREIENNGFFTILNNSISTKVYTSELMCILTSKKLPVKNLETQEEFFLNGFKYMESYNTGYSEGEKYFDAHYLISPNVLYGDKAEIYVYDIHQNYFHIKHTGLHEGWKYVKHNFPIIITHKSIKEFGYYSGIVSKVDEMVNKYSNLFQNFDKCTNSETTEKPNKLEVLQTKVNPTLEREENSEIIDYELLIQLNIDKYANWVMDHKSITRQKKKEYALSLLGLRDKNIANYRFVINEIFFKTKYWKAPTKEAVEYFPLWRQAAFNTEVDFFQSKLEGNPLPINEIKNQEISRVCNNLNDLYSNVIRTLLKTQLTEEFYNLANTAGIIDYLKWLDNQPNSPLKIFEPSVKENNLLASTIEDYLSPFKENINQTDYNILVSALETYFTNQSFPILKKEIKVSRINKKKLGWALNQLYRTERNDILPKEYLRFAKENISAFKDVEFDENNLMKSNLYKYFTTKT